MGPASWTLLALLLVTLWCLCWVVVLLYPRIDQASEIAKVHALHAEQSADLLRSVYPFLNYEWQDEVTSLLIRHAREIADIEIRPKVLKAFLDAH